MLLRPCTIRRGSKPANSYVVRAQILAAGRPLFTTDTAYPVLTRGKANTVSMLLRRAATAQPPGSAAGRALEKTYWKAALVGTSVVAAADPTREPHLVLEQGGKVAGSDGCNRLVGDVRANRGNHQVRPNGRNADGVSRHGETDRAFRQALENARRWKITGDGLELYDASGTRLARFEGRDRQ